LVQEHLAGAGQTITVDGAFGAGTTAAVRAFQAGAGLSQTGMVDEATWPVLLRTTPVVPDWTAPGPHTVGGGTGTGTGAGTGTGTSTGAGTGAATAAAARTGSRAPTGPWSARLKARRDEIPPGPAR
jgi:peptidoglycan hydrolase-like protein with peptidoglycan-binding domain